MRSFLIAVLFVFFSFNASAQSDLLDYYTRDISVDWGIAPSFGSTPHQPSQFGYTLNVSTSHSFYKKMGYRVGVNYIKDFEGTDALISAPIYLNYRTRVGRDEYLVIDAESFSELLFQVIVWLLPKNLELFAGGNVGVIRPGVGVSNNYQWETVPYNQGFVLSKEFYSAIEGGFRMNYRIWRFAVSLSPTVSYSLTKNFTFESENNLSSFTGYSPRWFVRATVGLSFAF
jgi:hypothetical protein